MLIRIVEDGLRSALAVSGKLSGREARNRNVPWQAKATAGFDVNALSGCRAYHYCRRPP